VRAYNSATSGSNVTKTFPRDVPLRRGVQVGTIFGEGPPPKIWEGKIRRDFKQLSTLIANISGTDRPVENRKSSLSTTTSPTLDKKDGELWSTNEKVIGAHVDPPKLHFSETLFRPVGRAGPSIFYTH